LKPFRIQIVGGFIVLAHEILKTSLETLSLFGLAKTYLRRSRALELSEMSRERGKEWRQVRTTISSDMRMK